MRPLLRQRLHQRHSRRRVFHLVIAQQPRLKLIRAPRPFQPERLRPHIRPQPAPRIPLAHRHQIRSALRRRLPYDRHSLSPLRRYRDRRARLDYARLFGGYLGYRVPQRSGVIQADGCDSARLRLDDVRGVKPPAKPDLYHLIVRAYPREVRERHSGQRLKSGNAAIAALGAHSLYRGPYASRHVRELPPRNRLHIHADALSGAVQMRRGVHPHLIARRRQHRGRHSRGAALAFSPGDVRRGRGEMRLPQPRHQQPHPLQMKRRMAWAVRGSLKIRQPHHPLQRLVVTQFRAHISPRLACPLPAASRPQAPIAIPQSPLTTLPQIGLGCICFALARQRFHSAGRACLSLRIVGRLLP